jgi:uncharacterized membrane protein
MIAAAAALHEAIAGAVEPAASMPPLLERLLSGAAVTVGVAAAVILLLGVLRGLVSFVAGELRSRAGREAVLDDVRGGLGQYLLLGLELLVAADVLETILTPSLDHVLALAGVVVIRTVIGFSLNWELERHQRHARAAVAAGAPPSRVGLSRDAAALEDRALQRGVS